MAYRRGVGFVGGRERSITGGVKVKIAFSPCPNDTFIFHAWVHDLVPDAPKLDVTYADIDVTNYLATRPDGPDVLKISCAALPWVLKDYALLPCGGALGKGCGPLILTKAAAGPEALSEKRVAVPSERSTAYLLFRLWAARHVPGGVGEILVMPFHEIMPAVKDGVVDAGLVIHEARFTYPSYGLNMLVDLGEWWERDTGLPIPLGAIIARRSLNVEAIADWIRASVEYAWAHPEASREYVMYHAQEMDPQVAKAHIDLYVNEFTANLGEEGYGAIITLLSRASQEGLVPKVDLAALR
jgi:1,4-dihydroxy-6-naphthoate synthase